MTEKQYQVITISREYAAYGRTIAAALSEALTIPYYDRDFVTKTAEESGYAKEDIEREGETISRGSQWLNSFLNSAASYKSSHDGIFEAQQKVILGLAKEPCILVGRCADYTLREAGIPSFDIYLYGSVEDRMKRAAELQPELTSEALKKYVERVDKNRRTYYKYYTGNEMGDTENYSIAINVGAVGVEKTIEILLSILKK